MEVSEGVSEKVNIGRPGSRYVGRILFRIKGTEYLSRTKIRTYVYKVSAYQRRQVAFVTQRRYLRRVSLLDHCGFLVVDPLGKHNLNFRCDFVLETLILRKR